MRPSGLAIAAALIGAAAAAALTPALAQQAPPPPAQTTRLRGVIDRVEGGAVLAKSSKGEEIKLKLAEKALVVAVVKASMADIAPGLFIGSGAMPQPDGLQRAIEVHIFAESMRGSGAVGASVSGVDGPVVTVKYKDGEKRIIVGPNVPIVRYEIADPSAITPGAPFTAVATGKEADGSFNVSRINVGRGGASPP